MKVRLTRIQIINRPTQTTMERTERVALRRKRPWWRRLLDHLRRPRRSAPTPLLFSVEGDLVKCLRWEGERMVYDPFPTLDEAITYDQPLAVVGPHLAEDWYSTPVQLITTGADGRPVEVETMGSRYKVEYLDPAGTPSP